jgi:nicotinamide-nucleotide amidase
MSDVNESPEFLAATGAAEAASFLGSEALSAEAVNLVFALSERGLTLGVAESLTGGLVAASVVSVPGASEVFRGGVVAYATELKHSLLGVNADLLSANGPVDPDVAVQMAHGVRTRTGADWGISTTGVAGPGPSDGVPAGTVYVAVASADAAFVRRLGLSGDRTAVRSGSVSAVLALLLVAVRGEASDALRDAGPAAEHRSPSTR